MIKKILVTLAILIGIYLILCIAGPKKLDVSISKDIQANESAIFNQLNDFRNWPNWSKWIKEDPEMKLNFNEISAGKGASYSWESKKSGNGSVEMLESYPQKLVYNVSFVDWESKSIATMTLKPISNTHTNITWTMSDERPFPFVIRGIMLLMNMKGAIIKDFEDGLNYLEAYLQQNTEKVNGYTVTESQFPATNYLAYKSKVKFNDVASFLATHFPSLAQLAGNNMTGAPCSLYWSWDEKTGLTEMAAAVPVSNINLTHSSYKILPIASQKEFVVEYYGSYDNTYSTYMAMDSFLARKGYQPFTTAIEEYITDPMTEKDTNKWLTRIHYLIK